MNTASRSASLATVTEKLWPTPKAGNPGSRVESRGGAILAQEVVEGKRQADGRMYSTPEAKTATSGPDYARADRDGSGGDDLVTYVAKMNYPTPRASEHKGTGPLGSASQKHRLEHGYLDATIQDKEQQTGQLNAVWVEAFLMGWPRGWSAPEPVTQEACDFALSGHVWDFDPANLPADHPDYIPRLSSEDKPSRRRARLQALGNGWVPQAAAVVLLAIKDAFLCGGERQPLTASSTTVKSPKRKVQKKYKPDGETQSEMFADETTD